MAALVVQSRFAGLIIEDDDVSPTREIQKNKKAKTNTAKKPEPSNKKLNKNGNKSQSSIQTQSANKKKKSKSSTNTTSEQWEQWKQKDEEMVDGNFEDELHQAIMLSKLDFEEKKNYYMQIKKQELIDKKQAELLKNSTKKQKKKVMSLEQFNDMISGNDETNNKQAPDENETEEENKAVDDPEFFEKLKKESRDEYLKEKILERVKHRQPTPDDVITKIQFADTLERKDKEIECLRGEVTNLKDELLKVKTRNRKLCNILGQGEMKDKAEILVEVERLRGVQAELTAEVESLHTELEKERSKNGDPRSKDKKKKGGSNEKEKNQP